MIKEGYKNIDKETQNYLNYISEHVSNVFKANNMYGKKILEVLQNESLERELFELCLIHDKSKYSDDEFIGYRKHFYPYDNEEKNNSKYEYDYAWLHHMNNNKHHPEYWIIRDNDDGVRAIEMPNIYIAEMILDWYSMYMKFHKTNPYQWFNSKYDYYEKYMAPGTFFKTNKIVTKIWGE